MDINIGELSERIQILELVKTEDPEGYPQTEERVIRSSWAKVSRASGTEQIRAGAEVLQERVRFLIRWGVTAITTKMVIRYRGADYQIDFINDYEDRHQFLEIWCDRLTQEG